MSGAEYVEAKYVEGPTGANMPVATASAPPIVVLATDQPPPIVVLATDQPPPPPYAEPETDALFYTSPTAETDAELAARLQAEEGMLPGPPASRVVVVESKYYGPFSFVSSVLLFCIFPPCAIVPCISPCDSRLVTVAPPGVQVRAPRRGRRRRAMVQIPQGVRCGDQLQTTTPDGVVLTIRVPRGADPGTQLCVEY
mmetsp:Transcript_18527/g.54784  ORF Transcript_18527/g.54784 Transcript_18527/m.54784 type:complete len:197 (-) Transcript_18527:138-728(-)